MAMADGGEIFVVSGAGRGHLQPCTELCNHLISRNYHTTLVIPSSSSSSSSFTQNPLAKILQLTASPGPPNPGPDPLRYQATQDLHNHLASLSDIPDAPLPLCAIVDFQMGWTKEVFWRFHVPVIGFFTFGASAASIEWGAWKVGVGDIRPDELRPVPGLPDHMALSIADLKRRPAGPPRGVPNRPLGGGGGGKGRSGGGGPPKPGDRPPWVPEIEGSMALMFNTCDFIDRAFIDYMKDQMGMPVWGVGPLLPGTYWNRNRNRNRPVEANQRQSNYTEDDVVQWLDSKPRGSVLYVAFGSEVGPNAEEYPQLASALEESTRPFIWVIQTGVGGGYNPDGLDSRVGERGLIICGWAPQQLILSHQSTGGFLSHCGWNSTVEAVCRGVPILGWPMRGDQYCNAKLVQKHLKFGYGVCESFEELVKKEDILKGIERLMGDEDVKRRALEIGRKFEDGFPASSAAALDDFVDFIRPKTSSQVYN